MQTEMFRNCQVCSEFYGRKQFIVCSWVEWLFEICWWQKTLSCRQFPRILTEDAILQTIPRDAAAWPYLASCFWTCTLQTYKVIWDNAAANTMVIKTHMKSMLSWRCLRLIPNANNWSLTQKYVEFIKAISIANGIVKKICFRTNIINNNNNTQALINVYLRWGLNTRPPFYTCK